MSVMDFQKSLDMGVGDWGELQRKIFIALFSGLFIEYLHAML